METTHQLTTDHSHPEVINTGPCGQGLTLVRKQTFIGPLTLVRETDIHGTSDIHLTYITQGRKVTALY